MIIESKKIRRSAKGEQCTVQIAGICTYDDDETVLAHLPSDYHGYKPTDISSCYACRACHAAIDQIGSVPEFEPDRDWYLRRANIRTLTKLFEKGLIREA